MAQINKPKEYFNTKLYTGNGSTQSVTGVGFQPDWVWIKSRSDALSHALFDAVRGTTKVLNSNANSAEYTNTDTLTAFGTDGFTVGSNTGVNANGETRVAWNWLAAGTAPSNTYSVKVVSDGGNKYRFDDFGTSAVTLEISEGGTYTFDQADSSNSGHPIRFSTTSDGTHGGGSEYTTGVTTVGTPGSAGAYTRITVAASAPTLYYYCSVHSGMGGQANTPTTNSFSSFNGSIQSNISPNTTSGFSIVGWTGNNTNGATVGHGLGTTPNVVFFKNRSGPPNSWHVYHSSFANATDLLLLDGTGALYTSNNYISGTRPSSSLLTLGNSAATNENSQTIIAYCFAEKQGYSKFGSYTGNGSTDGTFVYTGFKPAFIIAKESSEARDWQLWDNKRLGYNASGGNKNLNPNTAAVEDTYADIDILSNGFKIRNSSAADNKVSQTYIFMAFAENPLVGTNNIPATAR